VRKVRIWRRGRGIVCNGVVVVGGDGVEAGGIGVEAGLVVALVVAVVLAS
jgi:hypothetical protein